MTTTTTAEDTYEIVVRATGVELSNFITWNNGIGLNFYSNNTFTTKMNPSSLTVGSFFHFELDWLDTFTSNMPVKFYASKCTVAAKDDSNRPVY